MTLFRVEHKKNYTTVNNFICKDKRLSWKAKGIWLYAFSRPDDWSFYLKDLQNNSTDGREAVSSGLRELEEAGYLVRRQLRDEHGIFGKSEWIFFETPQELKKEVPQRENPSAALPTSDNSPLLSTDSLPSTELRQQQAAPAAVVFYECLKDIDIPKSEKDWLMSKYSEDEIKQAIAWTKTQRDIKSLAASIKWACKTKPKEAKKTLTIHEELSLHFKHGKFYNEAECILKPEVISFTRGMKQLWIKIDEFFSWKKLSEICYNFGIIFDREKGLQWQK